MPNPAVRKQGQNAAQQAEMLWNYPDRAAGNQGLEKPDQHGHKKNNRSGPNNEIPDFIPNMQ